MIYIYYNDENQLKILILMLSTNDKMIFNLMNKIGNNMMNSTEKFIEI